VVDQEQEKRQPKNLIPKSVSDALLAGGATGLVSLAFGVPSEYAPRVALAGAGLSLYLSWSDSRYKTRPKRRRKGRQIPFNHGRGSQQIDMEYSLERGGHMVRETYLQALRRKISGNPRQVKTPDVSPVNRPKILSEFIFHSHYDGQIIQLRKVHVDLFLKSAWHNRQNGKGLSARRWVRNFSQRPAWYKELSPLWYYAMRNLLYDAQIFTGQQIVIELNNQWSSLAIEPYQLIRILKWYEWEKRK
jgi:hypothetical protein